MTIVNGVKCAAKYAYGFHCINIKVGKSWWAIGNS